MRAGLLVSPSWTLVRETSSFSFSSSRVLWADLSRATTIGTSSRPGRAGQRISQMFELFSDIFACRDNALTRMDPRVKMMIAITLIVTVVLSKQAFSTPYIRIICGMLWLRMPVNWSFWLGCRWELCWSSWCYRLF
jgi:hypothetical protein